MIALKIKIKKMNLEMNNECLMNSVDGFYFTLSQEQTVHYGIH